MPQPSSPELSRLYRYAVPVILVAIAAGLRLALDPLLAGKAPSVFFIFAILVSARYGGRGPGLAATALSVLAGAFLFVEPRFSFLAGSTGDALNLALFTVVGASISFLCGQLRRALARSVEEQERFRSISNNVPQFLWTAPPDGAHDFMNARWFEYTGADPSTPIGSSWRALIHPDDLAGVSADWERLLALTGQGIREFRLRRHDGVYRWFETRMVALRDNGGRVVKWLGSTWDIQEMRELRETARAEAERFALIVATVPGLICQYSLRPDGTSGMSFASPGLKDIYDLDPADVVEDASQIIDRIHPDDRERVVRTVTESAQTLCISRDEFRILNPAKGELWVVTQSVPRREANGAVTWCGIVADVTARKRAEEEILRLNATLEQRVLERTAQLEVVNRELEAFCYTVSHDLRAPLRHMAGFANILVDEHGEEISAPARERLMRLQSGAQNMGNLIDDLLRLATIGRRPVSRRHTPLNLLADAAFAALAPQRLGRQIEWRIEELGTAECDFELMRLVFLDLFSNAIKYSRERDPAVIEVVRTQVGEEPVISVRDNGAGFDMAYANKLFGVFQRLHKARDFEGTGIGLATVRRIIQNHGGRVWAEAEPDRGATFSFTIPGISRD